MAVEEVVPASLAGERIDRTIAMITGASRARVAEWLADGLVTCNGVPVRSRSHRVTEGDVVALSADPDPGPTGVVGEPDIEVPVVFVDEHLLVIDKPAGLVVHPGAGHATGTLVHGLVARFPEIAEVGEHDRPGIVHRLDKDTSGLMLVARTTEAHARLSAMMAAHEVERRYLTLVWGVPESTSGMVDAPIGRSTREPTRMVVSANGREARTRYTVLESFAEPVPTALLECELETGRTHQIRVHMAAIGHAVVGDERYRGARPAIATPRTFLHSAELALEHPLLEEALRFESPLPADLRAVLDRLRDPRPTEA
ncbi:MAG: RluA family pseudouridine synthase [Acidimicrobiia bacterium]